MPSDRLSGIWSSFTPIDRSFESALEQAVSLAELDRRDDRAIFSTRGLPIDD